MGLVAKSLAGIPIAGPAARLGGLSKSAPIRYRTLNGSTDSAAERLTGAILHRLTHHVLIPETNGESFRLCESRKTNS